MIKLPSFRISPLRLLRARPLRPYARRLLDRSLWKYTPHAVGVGMAIGFFFGILVPVGQILFAVSLAVFLRGNLLTAAMSTLISNPLTFPPIYYLAWKTGGLVAPWLPGAVTAEAAHLAAGAQIAAETSSGGMLAGVGAASAELCLGLIVLAPVMALLGYLIGRGLVSFGRHWHRNADATP